MRATTHQRLKNLAALVLAVSYFVAVPLGTKVKMKVLARRLERAAKRIFGIPDFRCYAPADGISTILTRTGLGPRLAHNGPRAPNAQLSLWNR